MQKQIYDLAVLLNQMLKNFVNSINNDTFLIKYFKNNFYSKYVLYVIGLLLF